MHQDEVIRIIFQRDLGSDTAGHRESGDTAGTDERVDLAAGDDLHQLTEQDAGNSIEDEGQQTKGHDEEDAPVQEAFAGHGTADCQTQEQGGNVDDLILGGFVQTIDNTGLLHQVTQHQRRDQRSSIRRNNGDGDGDKHRENDDSAVGNFTRSIFHMDLAIFPGSQGLHDRRLNDRDQGHIGISGNRDRAEHMRSDLGCDINGCRAVNGTDGTDGSGFSKTPAQLREQFGQNTAQDQGTVNTKLSGSAEDNHLRHRQQRTEVDHRTYTDEDEEREKFSGNTGIIDDFHEADTGIHAQVRQNTAETDGQQQGRFIFLDDGQCDQHKTNHKHDTVLPAEMVKRVKNTAEIHNCSSQPA